MKLQMFVNGVLEGAFLKFARIGPEDMRKGHGVIFLALWIALFLYGVFNLVDHWIFPIYDIYLEWWPYRSINFRSPRNKTFPLAVGLMLLGGWVAYRTSKRCEKSIDYSETTAKEWICLSIWLASVLSATALTKNRYAVVILVLIHLAAFYFSSRRAG